MTKPQNVTRHEHYQMTPSQGKHSEESLKGTFVSVMLLGLFLVLSWVGVFLLFMARH
ncbi:cytochrome c oxidase subunit 2A [Paenibacillus naphthalenovorans]|uniref:cytochrome c oxidase subunit 2A n=1 Tax=Paenibacillus TaxID=44249 RepID=UPI000AEF3F7D|nr:cytochrome c oxidase subunit 2A [Paenibacillus naphthalenovorans]